MESLDLSPVIQTLEDKRHELVLEEKKLRTIIGYLREHTEPGKETYIEPKTDGPFAYMSLTPAIQKCLETANGPMTASEIMEVILQGGLKTKSTKTQHFLSNITTTLHRMEGAKRVNGKWILDKFLPKSRKTLSDNYTPVQNQEGNNGWLKASSH